MKLTSVFVLSTCALACAPIPHAVDRVESKLKANTVDKSKLDLLTDYDREIWAGPDEWSASQWKWKQALQWDRHCDYVAEVEVVDITNTLQVVTVQCVPGAYQPMYYVYAFDKTSKNHRQLQIAKADSKKTQEVWGHIEVDSTAAELSVLSLSRGIGDCGTFSLFKIDNPDAAQAFELIERRQRSCSALPNKPIEELPQEWFDHKRWPLAPL